MKLQNLSIEGFARLPLLDLSVRISEPPAPKMPASFALISLDNMMVRSRDRSKRGQRDTVAAIGALTWFKELGGKV